MGDLTLAEAKKKGAQALKEAKELVRSGKLTARQASRELIDIYWGIHSRLGIKSRSEFRPWFDEQHKKLGEKIEKELTSQ